MRKIVGISTERLSGHGWMPCWTGSLRRPTRRNCVRFLDEHLREELPGKESRAKATGIVLRIWSGIPSEARLPSEIGPWRCCPEFPARSASGCIGA